MLNTPIPTKQAIAIVLVIAIIVGAILLFIINAPLPPPPVSITIPAPVVTTANNPPPPPPANATSTWSHFTGPTMGISFDYPTFASQSSHVTTRTETIDTGGTATIYDFIFATPKYPDSPGTQYTIAIVPNMKFGSILDWFAANVDPQGVLLPAGAFQLRQLSNGMSVLVRVGGIPPAFGDDNGPIPDIFAMSSSTRSVVTLSTSNDNSLTVGDDILQQSYLAMFASLQVP